MDKSRDWELQANGRVEIDNLTEAEAAEQESSIRTQLIVNKIPVDVAIDKVKAVRKGSTP